MLTNILELITITWIVLSSGSLYFNILNMEISMIVLLILAMIYFFKYKRVSKINFNTFIILIIILSISTILNINNGISYKDIIILLIRLVSLMIIQSNIKVTDFKNKYIDVIYYIAIISLICFFITIIMPGFRLPFEEIRYKDTSQYILTFYYTKGWSRVFDRNSGLFWEPGAYQIYLNIALLFIVSKGINVKNIGRKFVVISVALFTTFSTTGYVCFALVCLYAIIVDNHNKKLLRKIKGLTVVFAVLFIIIEANTNIIGYKLFEKQGSFYTRQLDTKSTIDLALERPMIGYGAFSTNKTEILLNNYNVLHNSNGFGSFMISFGIPITVSYMIMLYYRQKKVLNNNGILSIISLGLFILFFNSESIMLFTFFLSFMFKWKIDEAIIT